MSAISNINWNKLKLRSSVIAAVGLMVLSAVGFNYGLNFSGQWGNLITIVTWVSFTVIQFIGNDLDNHDDWVFTSLWAFTYMVGIGAGTWALYSFIEVPNEYLHWVIAVGLAGAAEIAPERLIVMFLRSTGVIGASKDKVVSKPSYTYERPDDSYERPATSYPLHGKTKSDYTPLHRPGK